MSSPTDGYVLYDSQGKKIGFGTGRPELQPGETFVYSTDPENESDAIAIIAELASNTDRMNIEDWKSPEEYAGKAENAARWLASNPAVVGSAPLIDPLDATEADLLLHDYGDYTVDAYPWMSLEIDAKGCKPRECAADIMTAVKRADAHALGSWEKARRRIALRELLRNS